jgi:hypothetical protein
MSPYTLLHIIIKNDHLKIATYLPRQLPSAPDGRGGISAAQRQK